MRGRLAREEGDARALRRRARPARRLRSMLLLGGPVALVLALATGCGPEGGDSGTGAPRPERVVLLSMDTVRADHVPPLAPEASELPALRRLAAEGVALAGFHAASNYTLPSHMSMFTGLDPLEHGVFLGAARLAPEIPVLAERFAEAGYRTQSFNEGGYVAARYGFDRGFDEYRTLEPKALVGSGLSEVLAWVRAHRGERYLLFLHTYAAHFPYGGYERYRREHPERGLLSEAEVRELRQRASRDADRRGRATPGFSSETRAACSLYNQLAPSYEHLLGCGHSWLPASFPESPHFESDRRAIVRSYDAQIRRVDRAVARLRATLEEAGEWKDTLFVVTSDHGEAFYEHGLYQHDFVPFEEVMHVPLLVSHPRGLRGGGRVLEGPAWHPDLAPTLLALAGLEPIETPEARDLSEALRGEASLAAKRTVFPVVMSAPNRPRKPSKRVALRGHRKYVEGYPTFGDEEGLLFDLERDPQEERNLRRKRPEWARLLAARIARYVQGLEPGRPVHAETGERIDVTRAFPGDRPELSAEEERLLRGLGYIE